MSERNCSFAFQSVPENLSTSVTSSHDRSISPGDNRSQGGVTLLDITPLTTTSMSMSNSDTLEHPDINSYQDLRLDEAINPNHMELLIHLILDKEIFNLGVSVGGYTSDISFALKTGLKSPYLLHQLLAFSARRLAFLNPGASASYLHQAVTLQTRAVSLFNAAWTEVDRSNCVAILLFSVILGHHLLADTLSNRDPGGLDAFMTHYMQCVEMHRGIHTIARTAWPLLMESELEPILSLSSGFTSRPPRGNHCRQIRELVDCADGLQEEDKEACRLAIQYLQVGFDAVLAEEEEQGHRHQMIFSWTLLAPPEFTRLLAAKRPEVLVLLGYYALLLHYGRKLWQVGDAGAYLLDIIVDYLGPQWEHWLEYPRQIVGKYIK